MTPGLDALADEWREEAERLRQYGAEPQAQTLEAAADDLEERVAAIETETLTPGEAAEESGYSADHIRRLVRGGTIPDAGDDEGVRVRRRDVPLKPGHRRSGGRSPDRSAGSRARVARTVVDSD